jgi:hypothetical protein
MPNHTETKVRIQGAPPVIDAMFNKLEELSNTPGNSKDTGFLEQFIGDPANEMSESEKNIKGIHGMPKWYSARLNAWGTKWDIYDISNVERQFVPEYAGFEKSSVLTCVWNTAWSPCVPALEELSRRYDVDIVIEYVDEGLFFVGRTTIMNGEINLVQDYSGKDVYRGMYELFGAEHFFEWLRSQQGFIDKDFHDEILESFDVFVDDEKLMNKIKRAIKVS